MRRLRSHCEDIDWRGFNISDEILREIKRSNSYHNLDHIVAQAKSLLSDCPVSCYLDFVWRRPSLNSQEVFLSEKITQSWRKKYNIQKKKQKPKSAREKAEEALRGSHHRRKIPNKRKRSKKKKSKKTEVKTQGQVCVLCLGTGRLIDKDKIYSCPACSNSTVEIVKKAKKRLSLKNSPRPGNRKLKF